MHFLNQTQSIGKANQHQLCLTVYSKVNVFPPVELWLEYWHLALEFSPRGREDNLMVKTECLQPPPGDHHFDVRNIGLVFNSCNSNVFLFSLSLSESRG